MLDVTTVSNFMVFFDFATQYNQEVTSYVHLTPFTQYMHFTLQWTIENNDIKQEWIKAVRCCNCTTLKERVIKLEDERVVQQLIAANYQFLARATANFWAPVNNTFTGTSNKNIVTSVISTNASNLNFAHGTMLCIQLLNPGVHT